MTEDGLLEMGGDLAFLYFDDVKEMKMEKVDDSNDFFWDSTVDEDAHMD